MLAKRVVVCDELDTETFVHRSLLWFGLLAAVAVGLAACGPKKQAAAPEPRPVRTVTAKSQNAGEKVVLTGHIQAEDEASMAFRIGGRMTDRFVNVGDRVKPGQELARLDPQNEVNALRSAQAGLTAAQAAADPGAHRLRAAADAAGAGPHAARPVRSGREGAADRAGAGRCRRGAGEDRRRPGELHRAAGRCRRHGHGARRRAGRGRAGRTDDRAARAPGRTRRGVRRAGAGAAIGAERSADHGQPDGRSQRDDDRPCARGRAAGRSGDANIRRSRSA